MMFPLSSTLAVYATVFSLVSILSVVITTPFFGLLADLVPQHQRGAASAVNVCNLINKKKIKIKIIKKREREREGERERERRKKREITADN